MRLKEYIENDDMILEASARHIINGSIKSKINSDISKLLRPTYFKKIPLQPIFDILDKYGLVPLMEDQTQWDGMLLGGINKTERVVFDLGVKELKDEKNRYPVISRSNLILTYFKMESGKYEIVAYIG